MSRILPLETAFGRTREKQPRVKAPGHLDMIRQCPCLACGTWSGIEAAHLRAGDRRFAKRETGGAERPSDCWTLPLCAEDHRTGRDSQHAGNELAFWHRLGIDPFVTAAALWTATGHLERMQKIVREARAAAAPERSA